jgi:hypothetical protein
MGHGVVSLLGRINKYRILAGSSTMVNINPPYYADLADSGWTSNLSVDLAIAATGKPVYVAMLYMRNGDSTVYNASPVMLNTATISPTVAPVLNLSWGGRLWIPNVGSRFYRATFRPAIPDRNPQLPVRWWDAATDLTFKRWHRDHSIEWLCCGPSHVIC